MIISKNVFTTEFLESRKEEIEIVQDWIDKKQSGFVIGDLRIGKTMFISYLMNFNSERKKIQKYSFSDIQGEAETKFKKCADELIKLGKDQPDLIFIDDLDIVFLLEDELTLAGILDAILTLTQLKISVIIASRVFSTQHLDLPQFKQIKNCMNLIILLNHGEHCDYKTKKFIAVGDTKIVSPENIALGSAAGVALIGSSLLTGPVGFFASSAILASIAYKIFTDKETPEIQKKKWTGFINDWFSIILNRSSQTERNDKWIASWKVMKKIAEAVPDINDSLKDLNIDISTLERYRTSAENYQLDEIQIIENNCRLTDLIKAALSLGIKREDNENKSEMIRLITEKIKST